MKELLKLPDINLEYNDLTDEKKNVPILEALKNLKQAIESNKNLQLYMTVTDLPTGFKSFEEFQAHFLSHYDEMYQLVSDHIQEAAT